MSIDFELYENEIRLKDKILRLDFPILNCLIKDNLFIVLYDPDAIAVNIGQLRNLIAVNFEGELVWYAELPTSKSSDCFYQIADESQRTIRAKSFSSFECVIDINDGKIVNKIFYK